MLKILQPGFNSTWTVNFQMFKLHSEKAEEPEIKLPMEKKIIENIIDIFINIIEK